MRLSFGSNFSLLNSALRFCGAATVTLPIDDSMDYFDPRNESADRKIYLAKKVEENGGRSIEPEKIILDALEVGDVYQDSGGNQVVDYRIHWYGI